MYPSFKPNKKSLETHRSITKIAIPIITVAALVSTGATFASPVVNDLEISWPNDGWYQVQTADGQTTICEGMRSCLVEPGTYLVINHTTGERFNNITVADTPASAAANPEIPVAVVTVDGNTISWPDDGWYQVQSGSTFESFCNGESSCTVEDGLYLVINHTTGERFTNIEVGGDELNPASHSGLALDSLSNDIFLELDGYRLDETANYAPEVSAGIVAASTEHVELARGEIIYDIKGDNKILPVERSQYTCPAGGTMTLESGVSIVNESDYTHHIDYAVYDFDNCRGTVDEGVPVPDTYQVKGSLTTLHKTVSGSDVQTHTREIAFVNFDLRGDLGFTITTDANISMWASLGNDSAASRNVSITEYVMQLDAGVNALPLVNLQDATFAQQFSTTANGRLQSFSLETSGVFSGKSTDGVEVKVSTLEPLVRMQGVGVSANQNVPFKGRVQMRAADGTELTINANPDVIDDQSLLVDYTLRTADSVLVDSIGESLSNTLSKGPF